MLSWKMHCCQTSLLRVIIAVPFERAESLFFYNFKLFLKHNKGSRRFAPKNAKCWVGSFIEIIIIKASGLESCESRSEIATFMDQKEFKSDFGRRGGNVKHKNCS